MDALLLILAGLILLALGCALHNSYRSFERRAIPVKGSVLKLVRVENELGLGNFSNPTRSILVPLVTYEYRGKYQFIADENAREKGISEGDRVDLLIDDDRPRIAQLAEQRSGKKLPFIMVFSSLLLIVFGLSIFDMNNIAKHWQLIGLASVVLVLLSIKLIEQLLPVLAGDLYFENAEETEN